MKNMIDPRNFKFGQDLFSEFSTIRKISFFKRTLFTDTEGLQMKILNVAYAN